MTSARASHGEYHGDRNPKSEKCQSLAMPPAARAKAAEVRPEQSAIPRRVGNERQSNIDVEMMRQRAVWLTPGAARPQASAASIIARPLAMGNKPKIPMTHGKEKHPSTSSTFVAAWRVGGHSEARRSAKAVSGAKFRREGASSERGSPKLGGGGAA